MKETKMTSPEWDSSLLFTPDDYFLNEIEKLEDEFIAKEAAKAFANLQKEVRGKGCGCLNCLNGAVETWNSWVDMVCDDEALNESYRAWIDWSGRSPVIRFSGQHQIKND